VSSPSLRREERFRALYSETYEPVLRFTRRRLGPDRQAGADDVVAEAFLIAWRRLEDAPTREGQGLPWMYAVARNCLLNAYRSGQRQDALAVRVMTLAPPPGSADFPAAEVNLRVDLAAAWQTLTPGDQEVLALALFEDLTSRHAARVLGTTAAGYRMRLSRARRALRLSLDPRPTRSSPAANASTPILQENSR